MPLLGFCFPCSSSSAANNVVNHPIEAVTDKESSNTNITPPTGGEYADQATREFLNMLNTIAQAVPIPGFGAAVKIALNIIKACDESQATLERAEDLKVRIKTLVVVFVNELKGKKKEEIHAKLIQDIDALKKDLEYIKQTLDQIASQHRLLLVFFRSLNESKVNECVTRINNALEAFNLARSIDHTKILAQLEQQIKTFYAEQQESLNKLQFTMDSVMVLLNKHLPASATSLPLLRASVPAKSTIFYGRDAVVAGLVGIVTGESRRHVCLLGPGGMGKTSTSLAVMGHPQVKAHFADHLRVWVPCIKATSVSLFLDTLHSSLAVPKKTGNIEADIHSELRASPPIIILLDNLETPWNAYGAQSEVERILRDLHQIPHVTLFVTMRSSIPPCGDIPWHYIHLHAVDTAASHEIYVSWHPDGRGDPALPCLFELIGNMPLAIMLMAKIAKVTHLSAEELMAEFNRLGTPMLGQGSDAESSLDICIGLSVDSSRMKDHPEAFELLCTIALLPTGTTYKMLSQWWASDLPNLAGALDVLRSTSLIEERDSTYFVLPVIQHYILNPCRFHSESQTSTIKTACAFLKQHNAMIGDLLYKEHSAALSTEEDNLEAVLLQVTDPNPQIIRDGLLSLAHYQQCNRPCVDVVEHALMLAHTIDDKLLRGDILYCHGDICFKFNQYDKSLQQFQAALDLFITVPDRKKAAESRLALNNVLMVHHDGNFDLRKRIIEEAQVDFESVGDEAGVARCLTYLGSLHRQYGFYDIALPLLTQAEGIFNTKVQDRRRHAECTRLLAIAYYWSIQYDLAYSWAISSFEEDNSIGDLESCQLAAQRLGYIASARDDYKNALEHFLNCLKIHKSMGLAPSGRALEGMGLSWAKLGKTVDARKAFEESLKQNHSSDPTPKSRNSIIRTHFFLKLLDTPELNPNPEELSALHDLYTQDHIDRILARPFSH